MAKQRYINTKFWSDEWISNLDPIEKLLYLYLLTNERTTIAGAYELPLKFMALETGIEKEMIEKILKRFVEDKKITIYKSWIRLCNFQKYQDTTNDKIRQGIERVMGEIPLEIKKNLYPMDTLSRAMDTLPIAIEQLNRIESNLNSNIPPSLEEVVAYCTERNNEVDPQRWYNFYSAKGWMIGKNKMKDWKAAVRTWETAKPKNIRKL
jgi:hypothetical protein